jgi:hypothetical protein
MVLTCHVVSAVRAGDSYSHLLERLMDNPSVLDQLMNLTPIKRLIKDSALLKSLMNGDKGTFSHLLTTLQHRLPDLTHA